jgi:predicted acyltransferase
MERTRFLSLDVFRGMALCLMIVVNTPGAGSLPWDIMEHPDWFGFTIADIVFPSFLFAVGNAMALGGGARASEAEFWKKVLRRTAIIFALGVLTYWFPFFNQTDTGWVYRPFAETRIMGVLQRIALCYFFAAVAARYLGGRGLLALSATLLLGYWGVLLACAPDAVTAFSKTGNIGNAIDLAVLGKAHLYGGDHGFEPEGLLGTLPATVNVILGYLAGLYIRRNGANARAVTRFLAAGAVLILAALVWGIEFPIAKKLWTSTFVLLTVGIDLAVLAGLMGWIDIGKHTFGVRFFEIFGRNPIVLYVVAILLEMGMSYIHVDGRVGVWRWFGLHVMQAIAPGPLGSFLTAILYMLLCWLVALWMYRRNITIKV